jgi:hypothetical protein
MKDDMGKELLSLSACAKEESIEESQRLASEAASVGNRIRKIS